MGAQGSDGVEVGCEVGVGVGRIWERREGGVVRGAGIVLGPGAMKGWSVGTGVATELVGVESRVVLGAGVIVKGGELGAEVGAMEGLAIGVEGVVVVGSGVIVKGLNRDLRGAVGTAVEGFTDVGDDGWSVGVGFPKGLSEGLRGSLRVAAGVVKGLEGAEVGAGVGVTTGFEEGLKLESNGLVDGRGATVGGTIGVVLVVGAGVAKGLGGDWRGAIGAELGCVVGAGVGWRGLEFPITSSSSLFHTSCALMKLGTICPGRVAISVAKLVASCWASAELLS